MQNDNYCIRNLECRNQLTTNDTLTVAKEVSLEKSTSTIGGELKGAGAASRIRM